MSDTAPGGASEPVRRSLRSIVFVRSTGSRALAAAQADDAGRQQSQIGAGSSTTTGRQCCSGSGMADRCVICDQPLTIAPTVAMQGGGAVHIVCADQEAQTAWQQRRRAALRDLILLALLGVVLWQIGIALWSVSLGVLVGLMVHTIRHRRFWHYVRRDLRQLRLRR
jgi:hypothetical protein